MEDEEARRMQSAATYAAELVGLAAAVNAQCAEIAAANADRQARGNAMAYDGYADGGQLHALQSLLKQRGALPEDFAIVP